MCLVCRCHIPAHTCFVYLIAHYCSQEHKDARQAWKDEFNQDDAVLLRGKNKPNYTTTPQATKSGDIVRRLRSVTLQKPYPHGSKARLKQAEFEERFKDISVFTEFFGVEWDLISRIAADPAHEFHNLVKDMIKLICGLGRLLCST